MSYAIMRCKKLATMGSVASSLQHCYRERETPNAEASRTPDNEHRAAQSTSEAMGKLRELLPAKRRKDAVLAVEYVLTASPDWWKQASQPQQAAFFDQAHKWLADKYGADRVIVATIHRDEITPHLSAFVVPLTQDGRLSAKEFIGSKAKMTRDQTMFAAAVAGLGLERGIEGSKARHTRIQAFYEALERPMRHVTISPEATQAHPLKAEGAQEMAQKALQAQETARTLRDRLKPILDALSPLNEVSRAKVIAVFQTLCEKALVDQRQEQRQRQTERQQNRGKDRGR